MNRKDFMEQLERLLQGIAPGEREEALQYYNDYFDDAGRENEQEVIEALGNPARVAENIKKDLLGSGYCGGPAPKALASDRAVIEYGAEPETGEETGDSIVRGNEDAAENAGEASGSRLAGGFVEETSGNRLASSFEGATFESGFGSNFAGNTTDKESFSNRENQGNPSYGQETYEMPVEKAGMPPWATALLVTVLVLASPVLLMLVCVLFGILVFWYAVVFAAGVTAAALLAVLLILVVTGIICCFANPWAGMALVGSGLICGGIGLLFLMLTVAMGGIAAPAFWRGVRRLFRGKRAKI